MNVISTTNAPAALGAYSQAVIAGELVFISGQLGLDPETMQLATSCAEQMTQALRNLCILCEAANGHLSDIVKMTIYLVDMADFDVVNTIMAEFFSAPYPARACVQVAALPKQAKVEVDAIMKAR